MSKLFRKYGRSLLGVLSGGLFLVGTMVACEPDESCVSLSTNQIQLGFYVFDEEGVAVAAPFTFTAVDVLRSDSTFFNYNPAGVNSLPLPLDPGSDTTTFVFKHEDKADTLTVAYNRDFRMISADCGVEITYNRLQVFRHTFDSVQMITSELSGTDKGFDIALYSLEACNSPFTDIARTGFKIIDGTGEETSVFVNFDEVKAVGVDTALFKRNEAGIHQINLPLNPAADSIQYVFANGEVRDTLKVNYKRKLRVYSPECGVQTEFINLSLSGTHSFDTVRVNHPNLSETNQGFDIEIFK